MSELADRPVRVSDEILLLHWWRLIRWFSNLRLVPRWSEHRAKFLLRLLRWLNPYRQDHPRLFASHLPVQL